MKDFLEGVGIILLAMLVIALALIVIPILAVAVVLGLFWKPLVAIAAILLIGDHLGYL